MAHNFSLTSKVITAHGKFSKVLTIVEYGLELQFHSNYLDANSRRKTQAESLPKYYLYKLPLTGHVSVTGIHYVSRQRDLVIANKNSSSNIHFIIRNQVPFVSQHIVSYL